MIGIYKMDIDTFIQKYNGLNKCIVIYNLPLDTDVIDNYLMRGIIASGLCYTSLHNEPYICINSLFNKVLLEHVIDIIDTKEKILKGTRKGEH